MKRSRLLLTSVVLEILDMVNNFMKSLLVVLLSAVMTACVSPNYCKGEAVDPEHSDWKCAAAVTTDVVLVAGAVALVVVGVDALSNSSGGGSSSNYSQPPCQCPDDIAADGSQCGQRSAWFIEGGDKPYCEGYGWGR
ncbi:MAG: hypothetical protein ACRCUJ_08265 [Phocaeicola sp.]